MRKLLLSIIFKANVQCARTSAGPTGRYPVPGNASLETCQLFHPIVPILEKKLHLQVIMAQEQFSLPIVTWPVFFVRITIFPNMEQDRK